MKNTAMFKALILMAACFLAIACSAPEEAKLPLQNDSSVVVTINGKNLTRAEMHRELMNLILTLGPGMNPEELSMRRNEFELQAIQNLINTELLVLEASRRGIRVGEEEIQTQLAVLQQAYESGEVFRQELALRQLTPDELREEARRALLVEKLLDTVLESVPFPEADEIESFFEQNSDKFITPEQVHASHILVRVLPGDSPEVKAAKRTELDLLRQSILDGEETFEAAARAHSDCPSSARGGDLGWFSRDQMAPSFSEAAFSTSPGEISHMVFTEYGYHIIKVHEYRPEKQAGLEEIRGDLGRYIHNQRKKNSVQAFIESVRGRADIEISHIEE